MNFKEFIEGAGDNALSPSGDYDSGLFRQSAIFQPVQDSGSKDSAEIEKMYKPPDPKKLELFRAGKYKFPPPPVYTGNWDETSWIKYIDSAGRWLP